jgi:hypothetical protein
VEDRRWRPKVAHNAMHFVTKRSATATRLYRAVAPKPALGLGSNKKESMRGNWDE